MKPESCKEHMLVRGKLDGQIVEGVVQALQFILNDYNGLVPSALIGIGGTNKTAWLPVEELEQITIEELKAEMRR